MRKLWNLSLDPEAVARGQRYGKRHGKNLSQLVNDFLQSLPLESEGPRSPLVRRLYGVARGAGDQDDHRRRLERKYGRR